MTEAPLVLGFDTSAAHCAAALLRGNTIVCQRLEPMTRGQAERLLPLLEEILSEAGASWSDLDAIGVGVGPGNFTGIRIAVSAARGLALGLNIPAVGITGFEARTAPGVLASIPAPRDHVYATFPGQAPRLMPLGEAERTAESAGLTLTCDPSPMDLAPSIARLAAERFRTENSRPAPLYLRAADAAPSRDTPPTLLDA